MRRRALGAALLAGAVGLVGLPLLLRRAKEAPSTRPVAEAGPRLPAVSLAQPQAATEAYSDFVAQHAKSPDPKVQDRVGAAQMRLGYLAAKTRDLPRARVAFLAAAKTKGTGASGAFGTVSDQAAYQAVVCLVAEGKKDEAVKGFEALLKHRPLSPLAHAAYGRLKRLNGGETKPRWDALMQAAVAKQEAHARFETSVCGPKCLEHILNSPSPSGSSWRGGRVERPGLQNPRQSSAAPPTQERPSRGCAKD